MGEYILYVILIFIPIGGAMAYLLYKDGFPGKYINSIVFLSLLIILSFPISMERLGGLASLIIYVLLVAVTSWYILKSRVHDFVVLPSRSATGEQLINNLVDNNTSMAVEPAPEVDLTPAIIEAAPESDVIFEAIEVVPEPDITPEAIEVVPELTPEEDETKPVADLTPEITLEEKQGEGHSSETAASSEDTEPPKDIDVEAGLLIPETVEPVLIDAGTVKFNEAEEMDEEDPVDGVDEVDKIEEADQVGEVDEIDEIDEIEEIEEIEEIPETPLGKPDSTAVPPLDSLEPETTSPVSIIDLINNGFDCRDSNIEEAARYFKEAWQATSEYELKRMLTAELVEIYKECGRYGKARTILDSFIALPGHKSDIINEINHQIDYISLLTAELERLGISDLPISRVPRWVRLKVDGEMNPPGV